MSANPNDKGLPGLEHQLSLKGWTLAELARRSGVGYMHLWGIKQQRGDPSTQVLRVLRNTLACSADALLDQPDSQGVA